MYSGMVCGAVSFIAFNVFMFKLAITIANYFSFMGLFSIMSISAILFFAGIVYLFYLTDKGERI